MSVLSDIQDAMRSVIVIFGDATWQYRTLTSAYDVRPATYSGLTTFTAQAVQGSVTEEFDEKRGAYVRRARQVIKCSDAIALAIGDQVIDPDGKHWHVDGNIDAARTADGIFRYSLARDIPLKGAASERGGAV